MAILPYLIKGSTLLGQRSHFSRNTQKYLCSSRPSLSPKSHLKLIVSSLLKRNFRPPNLYFLALYRLKPSKTMLESSFFPTLPYRNLHKQLKTFGHYLVSLYSTTEVSRKFTYLSHLIHL